jgi:hypothetical protein
MFRFAITFSMLLTFTCMAVAQEADEPRRAEVERQLDLAREQRAQAERARDEAQRRRLDGDARRREAARREVELEIAEGEAQLRTLRAKLEALAGIDGEGSSPEQRLRLRRDAEVAEERLAQLRARREAFGRGEGPEAGRRPAAGPGGDDRVRRIRHMRVAAENLRAAGMHDLAATVMSKVEAYEREMRESAENREREVREPRELRARQARPSSPPSGPARGEVESLRREVQELREEVRRLRVERRPEAPRSPQPEQ